MYISITAVIILCGVVILRTTTEELSVSNTTEHETRFGRVAVVRNVTAKKKKCVKNSKSVGGRKLAGVKQLSQPSIKVQFNESDANRSRDVNQIDVGVGQDLKMKKNATVENTFYGDERMHADEKENMVDGLDPQFENRLHLKTKKTPKVPNQNLDVNQSLDVNGGSKTTDEKVLIGGKNENGTGNVSTDGQKLDRVIQNLDGNVSSNETTQKKTDKSQNTGVNENLTSIKNDTAEDKLDLGVVNSVDGQFSSREKESGLRKLLHHENNPDSDNSVGVDDLPKPTVIGDLMPNFGFHGHITKTSTELNSIERGQVSQIEAPNLDEPTKKSFPQEHINKLTNSAADEYFPQNNFTFEGRSGINVSSTVNPMIFRAKPIAIPDQGENIKLDPKPARKLLGEEVTDTENMTGTNSTYNTVDENLPIDDFVFDGRSDSNISSTIEPTNEEIDDYIFNSVNDTELDTSNEIEIFHVSAQQFNHKTEVCCSGSVYRKPHTYSYTSCCGSHQYTINRQVCCGNEPYRRNESYVCCGSKYHSPRDSMCCYHPYSGEAHLVPIAPGLEKHVLCCGVRVYDTRTHICCTMEISESGPVRPSGNQYEDRVTRFIIYERIYKNSGCCKGKVYNADSGTCFDVQLATRSLWTRLKPEVIHAIGVCGNESYDTKNFWCCSGWLNHNKSSPIRYRVSPTPCCGLYSYDEEQHLCCGGVRYTQNEFGSLLCCGNQSVYDVHSQECCDYSYNVIPSRSLKDDGDMCCGKSNTPYFSYREACCADAVIDVPQRGAGEFHCCINPYNSSQVTLYLKGQEICCLGIKYDLTNEHTHCCDQKAYSPDSYICCDGILHKKLTEFDACCASKPYNAHAEVCCGRNEWSLMKRDPEKRNCCVDYFGLSEIMNCTCDVTKPVAYPRLTRSNACCGLELYDSRTNRCCNSTIIDPTTELCCRDHDFDSGELVENIVEKRTPNSICCGNVSYNPESQLCCKGNIAAWKGLDDLGCCGHQAFNKATQICCGENVIEKGFLGTKCCANRPYTPAIEMCCNKTGEIFAFRDDRKFMKCCYTG